MVLIFVSGFFFRYYFMSKNLQILFFQNLNKTSQSYTTKKKKKQSPHVLESCLQNSYYLHIELLVHSNPAISLAR
jgi:hypothetical protein